MKNLFKKFSYVFLVLGLAFITVGCFGDGDNGNDDPSEDKTYVLSFEENGGNALQDIRVKQSELDGFKVELANPVKIGHTFLGWYLDADFKNAANPENVLAALKKGNVKVYANWEKFDLVYNSAQSDDTGSLNYWDSKDETVGNLTGYVHNGFWGTQINEFANGYEWICVNANEKPRLLNSLVDGEGKEIGIGTLYEFEVKVGSQLVYNTASENPTFAAYKGREVEPEDYLTAWKNMYNQYLGIERGPEGLTGAGSIKGLEEFYNATANELSEAEIDALWENVGYKVVERDGKCYIQAEFNVPCNPFYAMYYLASSLYCPLPQDFIDAVGGFKHYAKFSQDNSLSPVDTSLSTAYYVAKTWEYGKVIYFAKNELIDTDGRYLWEGVHIQTITAAKTDKEAVFKEFLAGHLETAGIPSTRLDEYKNHELTTLTPDSSTFKLNVNSCDQETWEALFGVNGSIAPSASEEDYWDVKPIMSNDNFLRGLSYSIDRKTYADHIGATPTANYFGSDYLSNPEEGVAYNSTKEHAEATETSLAGTDGYGYNLALAQEYFKAACDELVAAGVYQAGAVVEIEIAWQTQAQLEDEGALLGKMIEDAFNNCGGSLTLKINHWVGDTWSDVYYNKMMVGQFDLGFGSVSGNPLNPLNFLEVLRSDNSSGFTLNWGLDTNVPSEALNYDGMNWSFNALWAAADAGAYVNADGSLAGDLVAAVMVGRQINADGSMTVQFRWGGVDDPNAEFSVAAVAACNYEVYYMGGAYSEVYVEFTDENGLITATVPADFVSSVNGSIGFDVYFDSSISGVPGSSYLSFYANTLEEPTAVTNYLGLSPIDANAQPEVLTGGVVKSYVAASYEERTKILGILEKYAVENYITGLTLYGDGGYSMHNERLVPGSGSWDNYVPGYGFGVFSEGYATKLLAPVE